MGAVTWVRGDFWVGLENGEVFLVPSAFAWGLSGHRRGTS